MEKLTANSNPAPIGPRSAEGPAPFSFEALCRLINDAVNPARFFLCADLPLIWNPPVLEELAWEVFRGGLIDQAHTREIRHFIAWNIARDADEAGEPILSVKLDVAAGEIHVVRSILTRVWESFDGGHNMIESRETTKWVRELTGTIFLARLCEAEEVRDELIALVGAAIEGTSRLPLHSVEAPLPAFSLGQVAYFEAPVHTEKEQPLSRWQDLLKVRPLPLETLLRTLTPEQAVAAVEALADSSQSLDLVVLLRRLFNNVSLTPYTQFVDTTMAFIEAAVEHGLLTLVDEIDLWSWLLRQLGRHLTAYDLTVFHFRGANYPDALLLDTVLKRYAGLIEWHPELFEKGARLRRRAFRTELFIAAPLRRSCRPRRSDVAGRKCTGVAAAACCAFRRSSF